MSEKYSKRIRAALIIQFALLEGTDLFFDWDFFVEVNSSARFKGDDIRKAILFFAIWGTLLFLADLYCLRYAVRYGKPSKAEDFVNCLTTWTEDVPQMIMAVIVAVEVREPITGWVQYTKASLGIAESVIRCIIIIVSRCRKSGSDNDRLYPKYVDMFNFVGYLIIAVCAAVVWIIFET